MPGDLYFQTQTHADSLSTVGKSAYLFTLLCAIVVRLCFSTQNVTHLEVLFGLGEFDLVCFQTSVIILKITFLARISRKGVEYVKAGPFNSQY